MDYFELYTIVLFFLVFLSTFAIRKSVDPRVVVEVPVYWWMLIFAAFAIYCFANHPIPWGTWADRHGYAWNVILSRSGNYAWVSNYNEIGFISWIKWTSKIVDYQGWFYMTAIVYVGNYLIAAWRFAKGHAYVLFLMMLCCFQFYAYGTNTIRAGFAASFVMLGLSFCNDLRKMGICLIIGLLCHNSMIIPIAALILAYTVRKNNLFILGWMLCIFISFFMGNALQEKVSFLVNETRTSYLSTNLAHTVYRVGFRWDFLLYSSLPVFLGMYYIKFLNGKSIFYEFLYRMYLAANGFWILVIRANYTDRFAYLSWFLFPLLLGYPVLTRQIYQDCSLQARNIILVIIGEFSFTFFMYLYYGGSVLGFKFF